MTENEYILRPEDMTFEVVYGRAKSGGFGPTIPVGVKVSHIPSGISVEKRSHRGSHANKGAAIQELELLLIIRRALHLCTAIPRPNPALNPES